MNNVTDEKLLTGSKFNLTSNITLKSGCTGRVPENFPLEYRLLATTVHIVIFLIGFLGNIAVVIVVKKSKSMHTPTYAYLTSLAVADLIVLSSAMPEAIVSHHLFAGQWILGRSGCSLLIFGNFLGINASSISILCFTVERYIGICHPLLAQKLCSMERAKKIIMGTWLFAVAYCAPWLGLTITTVMRCPGQPVLERCGFLLDRKKYVYFFMADLMIFYVLPLVVAVVLYGRIGLVLHRSTKLHSALGKSIYLPSRDTPQNGCHQGSQLLQRHKSRTESMSNQERARIQVVRMLLVVVTLFAVLWLPYRGLLVYNSFAHPTWINIWYLLFAKTMVYLNSAINPILYNAMSKRFRMVFMYHIFCVRGDDCTEGSTLNDTRNDNGVQISPSRRHSFIPSSYGTAAFRGSANHLLRPATSIQKFPSLRSVLDLDLKATPV